MRLSLSIYRRPGPLGIGLTALTALAAAALPAQSTWQPIEPMVGSREHDVVYDAVRRRVVRVESEEIVPAVWQTDLWEWDDVGWTRRTPVPDPLPARRGHALAFDPVAQEVVLFGGEVGGPELNDTWVWDGETWTQRLPVLSPPPRCGHAMVYDAVRARVLLFGGQGDCGGCLTDTWEWDGATWTQRSPSTSPAERRFVNMAWDEARQRAVMFGGLSSTNQPLAETWEWDGSDWMLRAGPGPGRPPALPGRSYGMTHDATRQVTVLFGDRRTWTWNGTVWTELSPGTTPGVTGAPELAHDAARQLVVMTGFGAGTDTWVWNGIDWARRAGPAKPPAREHHAMAYVPGAQRLVVFGGGDGSMSGERGDTWQWDGFAWQEMTAALAPSARHAHKMATSGDGAILFGGQTGYGGGETFLNDTWLWSGTAWTQLAPSPAPLPRSEHAMAFDFHRNVIVLFGGRANALALNDTWEWTAGSWVRRFPANQPAGRRGHAMAYDAGRQRVVLFGGDLQDGTDHIDDTWEWDGTDWVPFFPATVPAARTGAVMGYDRVGQRLMMFGGWDAGVQLQPYGDIWQWDGVDWSEITPVVPRPLARARGTLEYDPARAVLTLFGGSDLFGVNVAMDDTWRTGTVTRAAAVEYGTGCGGTSGVPRLTGYGEPGLANQSFALDLRSARPGAAVIYLFALFRGAFPLPSGCTYLLDPATTVLSLPGVSDQNGFAALPVPIPADPLFVGGVLTVQGYVVDSSVGWGLAASNGVDLLLGY